MIERNNQSIRAVAMGAERTVETTQLALASLAASANGYEIFYSTKGQAPILVKSHFSTKNSVSNFKSLNQPIGRIDIQLIQK